MQPVGYTWNVR